MTYTVKKEGKGNYKVVNRYTGHSKGAACATHGEAQRRADALNRMQQSSRPQRVFVEEGAAHA